MNMKRLIAIVLLSIATSLSCSAQSWEALLEGLLSSKEQKKESTAKSEKLLITQDELVGKWYYKRAVVEYRGDDLLAAMAVGVVSEHIESYCAKAGLVAGRDNLTFATSTYRFEIDKSKGVGDYAMDYGSGDIKLCAKVKGKEITLKGQSQYKEQTLTLLFEAGDALQAIKIASPKLAENENIKIASQIIESLPGIYIGVELKR